MNTNGLSKFVKNVRAGIVKHSPEILIGLGIFGMASAAVAAVSETPKALRLIEAERERRAKESEDGVGAELTKLDIVKTTWKCYIPALAIGVTSAACLVGASSVHLRRNAALATAYALSESAMKEYRGKVIEQIGEKKEREVRDAVAKDDLQKHAVINRTIVHTGNGNTKCLDSLSGRFFRADRAFLEKVANDLNRRMRSDMYISLNEFYMEIGLDPIDLGENIGWNIDKGYIDLDISYHPDPIDNEPCLVLKYQLAPQYGYDY